jgi:replication-associated recombination protein RarA
MPITQQMRLPKELIAFLPHIESGLITLIGATTENPSFELNSALLSRLSAPLNPYPACPT